MEDCLDSLRLHVDDNDWELNDLIGLERPLGLLALALEIVDTYVIEWCRVQVLAILEVEDRSEVLRRDAAIR
jgi:hypothetical protein